VSKYGGVSVGLRSPEDPKSRGAEQMAEGLDSDPNSIEEKLRVDIPERDIEPSRLLVLGI